MKCCIATLGVIASLVIITSCRREPPTILLTLPNDYKGLLLITENRSSDLTLVKTGNCYMLHIPSNGRAEVNKLAPFFDWHKIRARYEDGRSLNFERPGFDNSQDAYYGIQYVPDNGVYGFVGSFSEYEWVTKRAVEKLPLGKQLDPHTANDP